MKRKPICLIVSCLIVVALLMASCGPEVTEVELAVTEEEPTVTEEEEPAVTEEEPAVTEEEEPAVTEEEPAVTEEEPTVTEEEEPAVTEEEPAVTEEEPAVTEEEPAVTEEEPAVTEEEEVENTTTAVPALAQTTATRDIADQTLAPGESTNATVTIDNAQIQALGLDEDPPADWTVAEVSSGGGAYQATLIEWAWVPSAPAGTIIVIYNLTVPLGTAGGTYTIAGTLISAEGTVAVGGETTITVSGAP